MALREQHDTVVAALMVVAAVAALDDALLELARLTSRQQQLVATNAALTAGEIARRSSPALGSAGLAQRLGHRTPHDIDALQTPVPMPSKTLAVRELVGA